MARSPVYPHELASRTIRLLTVEPGDPETQLQCKLAETCLDTHLVSYHALSYCWGPKHSPVEITCNSHPLPVTPNLHSFLLEYRRRGTSMPLWVDAICIDQSNVSERTSQVRMMDQIYSKADCVVVWLGEAEATDKPALELLELINKPWADTTVSHRKTAQEALAHDAYLSSWVPQAFFNALAAFLLRPWFSRMWIVQEFLLALQVTVWCGAETINEEFPVFEAITRFTQLTNCVYITTAAVMATDEDGSRMMKVSCAPGLQTMKYLRESGPNDTLSLIMMTFDFEATDPRDRIFALVGLIKDIDESFVDYTKSYQDVTKELSRMFLNGTIEPTMSSGLDVLSLIARDGKQEIKEPSWVMDFRRKKDVHHIPMVWAYPSRKPVINRAPDVQFSNGEEEGSLRIRGVVIDVITHIIPFPVITRNYLNTPLNGPESIQDIMAYYKWFQRVGDIIAPEGNLTTPPIGAASYPIYKPTGQFLYDAFWRTLCGNRSLTDSLGPPADHGSFTKWLAFLRIDLWRHETRHMRWPLLGVATISCSALGYRFRRNTLLSYAIPLAFPWVVRICYRFWDGFWEGFQIANQREGRDFEMAFSRWRPSRQFGVTRLGGIGLLPISARVGDSVGFFAGCRVPFVLRESEGGYKIVGDAYLHALMDGEADYTEGEMLTIV